jgi:hypothetical protein
VTSYRVGGRTIQTDNPDRVLFPDDRLAKAFAVESDKPQDAAGPSRDFTCILHGQTDELPADLVPALETGPQVISRVADRSALSAWEPHQPATAVIGAGQSVRMSRPTRRWGTRPFDVGLSGGGRRLAHAG